MSKPSGASGGPSLASQSDIARNGKEFNVTISPGSLQRETATKLGTVEDKDIRFVIFEDMVPKSFDTSSKHNIERLLFVKSRQYNRCNLVFAMFAISDINNQVPIKSLKQQDGIFCSSIVCDPAYCTFRMHVPCSCPETTNQLTLKALQNKQCQCIRIFIGSMNGTTSLLVRK